MASTNRTLKVHTYVGETFIEIPIKDDTTAEDVCTFVAKELKISPVARLLFALKVHQKDIFFYPGFKLSHFQGNECDFRLRFKVPLIRHLQKLDVNAFSYFYHQARNDLNNGKVLDLNYSKNSDVLVGLSVSDMYREMLEKGIKTDAVLSQYKRFVPRELLRKHKFWLKSPMTENLNRIVEASLLDVLELKKCYLETFNTLAPSYLSEEYGALKHNGDGIVPVTVRVDPFHSETPGILFREDGRKDWTLLCSIEDVSCVAVGNEGFVEIQRRNGIPAHLQIPTSALVVSFISLIDGYYRLGVRWTVSFSVGRDLTPPSLLKLQRMKCHGQVGAKFAAEKLKKKSSNSRGCFILRESETHYDTYLLDVCCTEGSPPEIFTIEPKVQNGVDGFMLAFDGVWYESVSALIADRKAEGSRPWLEKCLQPSEYDQPENLLLCRSPIKIDDVVHSEMAARGKHDIISSTNLIYRKEMPSRHLGYCSLFRGEWILEKGCKMNVAIRRLNKTELNPEFLDLATRWAQLQRNTTVRLLGISFSPTCLVMELLPMGPLDRYLQGRKEIIKEADLVEAAACVASAVWYLEENNIVHGNIRCRKVIVSSHDDTSMVVKLSDPGLRDYSSHDVHWLPPECHDDPILARSSAPADVWAFGTTLWEVFGYGKPLKEPSNLQAVKDFYARGGRLPPPQGCPSEIFQVMKECWHDDPDQRKQPQGLMRDLNQILYQGFSSRRRHAYSAAYPKRMRKAIEDSASISYSESVLSEITVDTSLHSSVPSEKNSLCMSNQDIWMLGESQEPLIPSDLCNWDNWAMLCTLERSEESAFELGSDCTVVLQGRIGQGFYGEVYRGTLENIENRTTEEVAVKKLKLHALGDSQDLTDFEREIDIMKKLKHENIVRMRGIVHEPEIRLVMEYVPLGSLQCYLRTPRKEPLTHHVLLKFALDVATGMEYLGSQKIVHRDLATRNILVAAPDKVKISDFGLAQVMGQSNYYFMRTNRDLPIRWYAPESLSDGRFSALSDVWSFGVAVWEMFTGAEEPQLPGCDDQQQQLSALREGTRLPRPEGCPESVYSHLMFPCWHAMSPQRPTFTQLRRTIKQLDDDLF